MCIYIYIHTCMCVCIYIYIYIYIYVEYHIIVYDVGCVLCAPIPWSLVLKVGS